MQPNTWAFRVIVSDGCPLPRKYGVFVPLSEERAPVGRRHGKTVKAVELEDLIRNLSGPERELVRGYIDAIVDQRAEPAT